MAKGVLGQTPSREGKKAALGALRDRGVFLVDLKPDPFDSRPLHRFVGNLVDRCRLIGPRAIVLIKADAYDAARSPPHAAGLPVVEIRIPFPGSGQQRKFESSFSRALEVAGATYRT